MDVLLECCAGIDVAKDEVVACVRKPGVTGRGGPVLPRLTPAAR